MKANKIILYAILFICVIFKVSTCGFEYFPTMDDNNQYGIYHLRRDDIYKNVIQHYKLYGVRPLAFYTDAYIFSKFWNNMYSLLFILTTLYFATGILFENIMQKLGINFGFFGLLIFMLAPFLLQATYWISASSRIVLSLFFCILSVRLFIYYEENKKHLGKGAKFLIVLITLILNILCTEYYEQTIIFNLIFFAYVAYKYKSKKFIFLPIASTIFIGIHYYISIKQNTMQERGILDITGVCSQAIEILRVVFEQFIVNQGKEIINGTKSEIKNIPICLISSWLSFMIAIFVRKDSVKCNNFFKSILFGIIIFWVPLVPFLFLKKAYIDIRNFYISYLGFSIILSTIYYTFLQNIKYINSAVVFIFTFIFLICNSYEIMNYKKTYDFDNFIARQIIKNVDNNLFENSSTLFIDYDNEILNFKNESKMCRTILEEDWAVMGKIQILRNSTKIGKIVLKKNQKPYIYINKNLEIELDF